MTKKEERREVARLELLKGKKIKSTSKLLIVIKSVSRSGMARRMRVLFNNQDISYWIKDLCDLSMNDSGLLITGCGMDMTFWLADCITYNLWPTTKKSIKSFKGNGGSCLDWQAI